MGAPAHADSQVGIVMAALLMRRLSPLTRLYNSEAKYEFMCWFDEGLNVQDEVDDALAICGKGNYITTTFLSGNTAVVQAVGDSAEVNRSILECVRSFLLMHGWEAADREQPKRSWKERVGWYPKKSNQ